MSARTLDTLSMLALKVAPNVFDLSSGQLNISVRDQIVRAQLLIRDLMAADPAVKSIVIVGGGVAGLAAADMILRLNATMRRAAHVHLIEQGSELLRVQKDVTSRYIGAYMYEWPASFHSEQSYPGNIPGWGAVPGQALAWSATQPVPADSFRTAFLSSFGSATTGSTLLHTYLDVDPGTTRQSVKRFITQTAQNFKRYMRKSTGRKASLKAGASFRIAQNGKGVSEVQADYVLLAIGIGRERSRHPDIAELSGADFWENDGFRQACVANEIVGIFGGGDGALQDVLRSLTRFPHPLRMMAALCSDDDVRSRFEEHYPKLLDMEAQARLLRTWTAGQDPDAILDVACDRVAKELAGVDKVVAAVRRCLRCSSSAPGKVVHLVKESHFTKCYLLNRFLVHLIKHVQGTDAGRRMRYELRLESEAVAASKTGSGYKVTVRSGGRAADFSEDELTLNRIAVRLGVDGAKAASGRAGQLIQLSKRKSAHRANLGRVPLPYFVP